LATSTRTQDLWLDKKMQIYMRNKQWEWSDKWREHTHQSCIDRTPLQSIWTIGVRWGVQYPVWTPLGSRAKKPTG
jgi:hypothetical protein